ncbi:hypothetical protein SD70_02580 [Gordoniibacillus kamchatkensis]|uniref:Uncharacterized protein n=1 Tax=Gordoniibacillus kamchatkensis TaxID=1590651 RepID=A0ABR5AM28_9BACL|nr:hypothetical protein [Paenibacillus sp. VKM B-2647]KIL42089.1 hypothetical protein SD70_02580 [Paenibacillus sp. VKM B-2647]
MLREIFNNLHPAINRDPQETGAIQITAASGKAIIQNDIMQLTGPTTSAQFNLRSYTLETLAQDINALGGFTATTLMPGTLSALVLLDGTYSLPFTIPMFTSFLWQFFKPVALALVDALGAENQALLEMVLTSSDGAWLNEFGETLFGIYRQDGEPDELYAIRIFDFALAPRINNMAIKKTLQDLGYNANVTDNGPATFDVDVVLPSSPPQGFVYSYSQIGDLVGLLKAAGTTANIILSSGLTDGITLSESLTSTLRPSSWVWESFIWDQFTWG